MRSSKCDLISTEELEGIEAAISGIVARTTVLAFSNLSEVDIETIKNMLLPEHSYCLLGSSGVGKTTLLNSILGSDEFETQSVSRKDSKGRHTTTSRELIQLENGASIIDTPGMRELGNLSIDGGLEETFSEIFELAQQCKFTNCLHTTEKSCAVLTAIKAGEISAQRLQNYLKMKKESAFNDMSYFEKRQKDKAFGALVKTALKSKHKY